VIDLVVRLGDERVDRVEIARGERRSEASGGRARDVWPHAAPRRRRRHEAFRQLFEARQRLGLAIVVEPLSVGDAPVGAGREEREEGPLVGAAAGPVGAPVQHA